MSDYPPATNSNIQSVKYYEQAPPTAKATNISGSSYGVTLDSLNLTGSTSTSYIVGRTGPTGSTSGSTDSIKVFTSAAVLPKAPTMEGRTFRLDSINELAQSGTGNTQDTI